MSRDVSTKDKSGAGYDLVAGNDAGPVIECVFWDREGGQMWRTDPEPRWVITEQAALETHLKTFLGNLRPVIVGVEAQALGVLLDHVPHLIDVQLDPDALQAALDQYKARGAPPESGGSLTVKPEAAAASVIEGLIKAGLLTSDGQRALPTAEKRAS
jgi:hypothetical protein